LLQAEKRRVRAGAVDLEDGEDVRPVLVGMYVSGVGSEQVVHAVGDLSG